MKFLALQPLNPTHVQAAVELDRHCLGGLWTESGYQREIDSPNSDLLALRWLLDSDDLSIPVLDRPAPLIGLACSWAILDEAHITLLAIDPVHRQQGLGQLLLVTLLGLAQQRGLEWATLEVRASNQTAISLYHKFGFESVGQRRRYYPNGEDALILWCKGLQQPQFQTYLYHQWLKICDRLHASQWQLAQLPDLTFVPDSSIKPSSTAIDSQLSPIKSSAIPLT